jgi:hypothetical protein
MLLLASHHPAQLADGSDKELRRYLIWRWGLEGIVYDIHKGPQITLERDRKRLRQLCDLEAEA